MFSSIIDNFSSSDFLLLFIFSNWLLFSSKLNLAFFILSFNNSIFCSNSSLFFFIPSHKTNLFSLFLFVFNISSSTLFTISLIDKGTPVISIATDDKLFEKTVSNIKETKARGSYSIFVTTQNHGDDFHEFADKTILLPKTTDFTQPILTVVALQLIAYETAKLRGCDIDKPRNLAKSVTVE